MSETTPNQNSPAKTTAKTEKITIKSLLSKPEYQARFKEVLGTRANQFVASVISLGNTLPVNVDPPSVVAGAMTAAVLDLPVDKNLGFAWIVPYRKNGVMYGQFQLGYKGYVQLGLRSGQYKRMNARAVNEDAVGGFDEVGERIIHWDKIDEEKPVVGYVFAFQLVNGFTKVAYWEKKRVEEHAKRYSQAFRGGYDSPWKSNFDSMALKSVIKNELARWGLLSIDMQKGMKHDQGVQNTIDADPDYIDIESAASPEFESEKSEAGKSEILPDKKDTTAKPDKDAKDAKETKKPEKVSDTVASQKTQTIDETPTQYVKRVIGEESGVPFDDFRDYVRNQIGGVPDLDSWASYNDVNSLVAAMVLADPKMQVKIIKTYGKKG
jgi:recombination protein RecT